MKRIVGDDYARFMQKIEKSDSGCWNWTASKEDGYGRMMLTLAPKKYRAVLAHRWSYEHHVGPISDGLVLDHLCMNRACVNPEHLELVSPAENYARGYSENVKRGMRVDECIRGHDMRPNSENVRVNRSGTRACRACDAIRAKVYRAKVAA